MVEVSNQAVLATCISYQPMTAFAVMISHKPITFVIHAFLFLWAVCGKELTQGSRFQTPKDLSHLHAVNQRTSESRFKSVKTRLTPTCVNLVWMLCNTKQITRFNLISTYDTKVNKDMELNPNCTSAKGALQVPWCHWQAWPEYRGRLNSIWFSWTVTIHNFSSIQM